MKVIVLFIFFVTIYSSETVESIIDFNSIPEQPRTFTNTIRAIIETEEDAKVAKHNLHKIDKIISKGFSLELDMQSVNPYIDGEWTQYFTSDGQYIHLSVSHFGFGGEVTFQVAEAVIEILNKHNLEGVVVDDLEQIFYEAGRSTRDVRLMLRRLGIELHKINKKVGAILPPKTQALSRSDINSLSKFVDFYIIYNIDHYDKQVGSHCLSPIEYNEYLIEDTTKMIESLLEKTSIIIDFRGIEWCEYQGMHYVNNTVFAKKMKNLDHIEYDDCQEHIFFMKDKCRINYPTVESIKLRLEFARKYGLSIVLVHLDSAHPNFFNLL